SEVALEHLLERLEVVVLALDLDLLQRSDPATDVREAAARTQLLHQGDQRSVDRAHVIDRARVDAVSAELVQDGTRQLGVFTLWIHRAWWRLRVEILGDGPTREALQLHRERVDADLVREIVSAEVRGAAELDEDPIHVTQMSHLLHGDFA